MTINTIQNITIKVALILLAITCTACSTKPAWVKLIQTETSVHYFMDKPDNKPREGILYTGVFSLYRYPVTLMTKNKTEIRYRSKEETIMIDCKKKLLAAPDSEYYEDTQAKRGTEIYFYVTPPDQLEWLPIKNNPVFEALYTKVSNICR